MVSVISLMILKTLFCLSRRVSLVPLAVEFYVFCVYLCSNNQIILCIDCPSRCICSLSIINLYIGKWFYSRIHLLLLYCVTCLLLSDPNTLSKHVHRIFLRLFWETYRSLVLLALCHRIHSSRKKHISSKVKSDTL